MQRMAPIAATNIARNEFKWFLMYKLSALIVANNEENMIGQCLESVDFADEIVVVLDRCTDATKQITLKFNVRIIEGAWPIEGQRRHAGINACSGDWILEVDADERISKELATEIQSVLPTAESGYFLIPYHNYVGQRLVVHGWGAYNGVGATVRLFTPGCKAWGPQSVHPSVTFKGERRSLNSPMIHLVDDDIADMFARMNRDTTKAAVDAVVEGRIPSLSRSIRRIFTRFFSVYVLRKGYREGAYGLALGIYAAMYPILVHIKCRTDAADKK